MDDKRKANMEKRQAAIDRGDSVAEVGEGYDNVDFWSFSGAGYNVITPDHNIEEFNRKEAETI